MSNKVIVFQPETGPMGILIPCECGLSILDIGKKDVPEGLAFWIIDRSELPTDRETRNALVIDEASMPAADGIGGTYV